MKTTARVLVALAVCLALGACTKKVKTEDTGNNGSNNSGTDNGAQTNPMANDGIYGPEDLDTDACLRQRVVYFDFDQDSLNTEFQAAIACHAKYLRDRPSARMTLEGNADERGTREYNVALGERRGNAVSAAVQGSGGSASQITVTSLGEERPTCLDSTEDCWAKNRRVEISYSVK
ncbi:MAG: peptidoglycan-associated lipoprotein Pal [Arenimonas sp.]